MHADQGFSAQTPGGPLRVLLVIKCLGYGGAERLLVDMVAVGDRRRFDYEVAYVLRDLDALVPSVVKGGTPVHALGAAHNADLRWMAALRRVLVQGHYDVVHFHLPYAAALGQLVVASLPRSARPGVVYTEHSLWDRTPVRDQGVAAGLDGKRRTAGHGVAGVPRRPPGPAATPGPNGGARCRPVPVGLPHGPKGRTAGRRAVRTRRGTRRAALHDRGQPATREGIPGVARCGSDHRRPRASHSGSPRWDAARWTPPSTPVTSNWRSGDRFQFLGQRDDVLELLAGADAFVLASLHEGLPVTLMEATSVGLPIVATSVGGIPQILEDEVDALLVPPGDPGALVEAMTRLASDPELRERLGRRAKLRSSMFDIVEASRTVGDIYVQVSRAR